MRIAGAYLPESCNVTSADAYELTSQLCCSPAEAPFLIIIRAHGLSTDLHSIGSFRNT